MNYFQPHWFIKEIEADKVYFNYKRAPYMHSRWMLYLPIAIESVILLAELFLNHSAYLQFIMIPLALLYTYRILRNKEDLDRHTERTIVEEQLTQAINRLCGEEKRVVAKDYYIITPKELYLRDKRFLLILMSDGAVYRFAVDPAEKNGFILDKQATLCMDEAELSLLKKKRKATKEGKKAKAQRIMGIAAVIILCLGAAILVLAIWLGCKDWARGIGYILLADLFLSLLLMISLKSYDGKKSIGGALYKISFWNVQVWYLLIQLIFPVLLLLVGLLFIIILPFSLLFTILSVGKEAGILTLPTALFVSLSIGAIVSAHYSKPLFGWLSKLLTANGHKYEKYFKEMVEYVYQPAIIEFIVNLAYVLYLVVSTILRLQSGEQALFGNNIDLAILESFLVFLAFSNMKKKRESASFSFSELFRMIYGMWTTHDIEEDEE